MRRLAIAATLTGIGLLVARASAPKLHARLIAGCERMFQQMPDNFPPKRMMRGIEEIRANTARMLELLEERKPEVLVDAGGEPEGVPTAGQFQSRGEAVGRT